MGHLRATDWDRALKFALEAQAIDGLQTFRTELVPSLRRLVSCDTLGYNEIDVERRTAFVISDAPAYDGIERRFLELAYQHPMVPYQRRGDLRAYRISDFLSAPAFHSLELYHDIYRPLGIEDQLAFGLSGETIVAINLGRGKRTFTERDRQLLDLLRPHLARAHRRARDYARTEALIEAIDRDLSDREIGVIVLDQRGGVEHVAGAALELVDAYLGGAVEAIGTERNIAGPRDRLRISEQTRSQGGRVLILEEQRPCAPSTEALQSHGLTPRQAQVMRLVACGKPSHQVAAELRIEVATVEKHLEHIYARLGVSSRAAAIARVYA